MVQGGSRQTQFTLNTQPLVSIIMATYNAAAVLKGAIESAVAYADENIEIIIVDGDSTDETITILKHYDNYITRWQSEPDKGIYDALNKGIKLATGKWLYFMGADDRLLVGFKEMATHLQNNDTLYYGDVLTDEPVFSGQFSGYRLAKYCINHQTIFYPEQVFKNHNYDTRYNIYADYALNIACWGNTAISKKYYPIKVAFYNLNGHSSTANDDLFKKEKPLIIKKYMGWLMYLRFLYKRRKEQKKPGSNFY